jgi:hypothetical protein
MVLLSYVFEYARSGKVARPGKHFLHGSSPKLWGQRGCSRLVLQPLDETESFPVGSLFPPLSPNGHRVDKSLRLGCPTPRGIHRRGPNSALKYPNAHQVGKNDRAGAKKFRLRKIYMPELSALVRSGLALAGCGKTLPDGSRRAAALRHHD